MSNALLAQLNETELQKLKLKLEIMQIFKNSVSSDYANSILLKTDPKTNETLINNIMENVLETSAWVDEKYYNDDDIKLAIGRELAEMLQIERT